jgi:hypothetical protein
MASIGVVSRDQPSTAARERDPLIAAGRLYEEIVVRGDDCEDLGHLTTPGMSKR